MRDETCVDIDYKQLRKKAVAYAKKRGYGHLAEDFAQEFVIEMFKSGTARLEWVLTELLRREYGSARSSIGRERMRINHSLVRETRAAEGECAKPIVEHLPCVNRDTGTERSIRKINELEALKDFKLNEVEPYPKDVIIGRGAICDASVWEGPLPRNVK